MTIRYRAEWVVSVGDQPVDSFEYDRVEYDCKVFGDRQAAVAHAHAHDISKEGKVYAEELQTFRDADGPFQSWEEIESIYCLDDGTTETISTF